MAGAAVMAARSALRAGIGLLRIASPKANRSILQESVPEAIHLDPQDSGEMEAGLGASTAIVAGPGIGTDDAAAATLARLLGRTGGRPLALDADALNLVGAGRVAPLDDIAREHPLLVTPHVGEMARIVALPSEDVEDRRVDVARAAARDWGCALLLKGTPSLVADPAGKILVDTVGSSDLAAAGMGDVLAGAAGSFLAQGASPARAGALALHFTGRAAVRAYRGAGLTPGDVIDELPEALMEDGDGETDLAFPFVVFDQDPAR